MAELIKLDDNRSGYLDLVDLIRSKGRQQESRNGSTYELSDALIVLKDPTRALPVGINRVGYSHALASLEALQLVGGYTDDALLTTVAFGMKNFVEDDKHFHGAYGRRIAEQLPKVVTKLRQDPTTRQAVTTLWEPDRDNLTGKKDYPCTVSFVFRIRYDKLLMSTFMRSNDIHLGWPYDVVMFTALQLSIARALGIEAGPYTHHAVSLHVYESDLDKLDELTDWDGTEHVHGPIVAQDWIDTIPTFTRYVGASTPTSVLYGSSGVVNPLTPYVIGETSRSDYAATNSNITLSSVTGEHSVTDDPEFVRVMNTARGLIALAKSTQLTLAEPGENAWYFNSLRERILRYKA